MRRDRLAGIPRGNVPAPEPHVGGLLVGAVLHLARPWALMDLEWVLWSVGALLSLSGAVFVTWSVVAVGRQPMTSSTSLVTTGPYRYSRNPMYVGWTALYLGVAALANSAWPAALLPLVGVFVHRIVRREERALGARFGDEYRRYRTDVRRYL